MELNMLKRFVHVPVALFFCYIHCCSASNLPTELSPLIQDQPRQQTHDVHMMNMEPVVHAVNLLIPAINRQLTPQEKVFYNHDLLNQIAVNLNRLDQENLACTNIHIFKKIAHLFTAAPDAIDQLSRWVLYGNKNSKEFRTLMLGAHAYLSQNRNMLPLPLRQKFVEILRNLLHESRVRHPYTLNIDGADREILNATAILQNIKFPIPTLRQKAWALYNFYRSDNVITIGKLALPLAAVFGSGIYIIYKSTVFPPNILGSNCELNVITNANIDYGGGDPVYGGPKGLALQSIPDYKSSLTVLPIFMSEFVLTAAAFFSSWMFPHDAYECMNFTLQDMQTKDLMPDTRAHPIEQDMRDFLSRIKHTNHYVPASHLLLYKARKFNAYVQDIIACQDVEMSLQLDSGIMNLTRMLTAVMSGYRWSPTYRLFGGENIKQELLSAAGLNDLDTLDRLEKIRVALYADYFVRYLPSSAYWYGMYQMFTSHFMGSLKEVRILGDVYANISYGEYMKSFVNLPNCCLTDTGGAYVNTNSLCPPLGPEYSSNLYKLANHRINNLQEWEYKVLSLPMMILFFNIFYFIMG
jgi:hypothetical protein